jgi:hypothetical protein
MTQKPAKPATEAKRSTAATTAESTKPATRAKRAAATTSDPATPVTSTKRTKPASAAKPTKPVTRAKREAATSAEPANQAPAAPAVAWPEQSASPPSPGAPATRRRAPSHDEICARAYFIALEEGGGDEVTNWLRAERELATA